MKYCGICWSLWICRFIRVVILWLCKWSLLEVLCRLSICLCIYLVWFMIFCRCIWWIVFIESVDLKGCVWIFICWWNFCRNWDRCFWCLNWEVSGIIVLEWIYVDGLLKCCLVRVLMCFLRIIFFVYLKWWIWFFLFFKIRLGGLLVVMIIIVLIWGFRSKMILRIVCI